MIDTVREIKKASAACRSSLSGRLGIALSFLCFLSMSYLHLAQKVNAEIWVHLDLSDIIIVALETTRRSCMYNNLWFIR